MKHFLTNLLLVFAAFLAKGQTNIVTYAGNAGKETFYDVLQLSDGSFLVSGYAENLDWLPPQVPATELTYTGSIPNAQGTNRYGILLQFSEDFQSILHVVHFPKGTVEDIRFVKTDAMPYVPTGNLYISCNTTDSDDNDGGYLLAKLNNNFVNGVPTSLVWHRAVWAKSGPKDYHPWDVTNDGRVFHIGGEAFGYDWSAVYCLDQNGQRTRVENWRNHWLSNGNEWRGTPASANPLGSPDSVAFSGIVLKIWGRCDLRSWTPADYYTWLPDGNGGTRMGRWPTDFLFNGPCDPAAPTANGPSYTGYSAASGSPVHGGTCVVVDRRNNDLYLGMNFKSVAANGSPDFEPAVVAMDVTGTLRWWSRLYHEVTPIGDTVNSIPDQYVDALAIDYANEQLVVAARAHGNNVENLWEGNSIAANPGANAFQNQFTGTNGNIHQSWLGKLRLADGVLAHATYVAELAEGTGSLGSPHPDPNLDGWPDPNTGWPDVNTTRLARNNVKVSSNGAVCVLGVGRRTITTANAHQKMVKPFYGGKSCWNSFVRAYDASLNVPLYSSLVVGQWDTLTQAGGDNTELFGIFKTNLGVVCVGRQKADLDGSALGNDVPVAHVPGWGTATPTGESALLVYYRAQNLLNEDDGPAGTTINQTGQQSAMNLNLFPNPTSGQVSFSPAVEGQYRVIDGLGRQVANGKASGGTIQLTGLPTGCYFLQIATQQKSIWVGKIFVTHDW